MRLIDADSLLVNMDKGIQATAREYLKFYRMAVNDEPTAYDVDKAVEQIKEEIAEMPEYKHKFCESVEVEHCMQCKKCEDCMAERIIEIVKSGGIE